MKSLKERERSVGEMDSVKLRCTREMGESRDIPRSRRRVSRNESDPIATKSRFLWRETEQCQCYFGR